VPQDWRVVSATENRPERWKNGLGWTTEIVRVPDTDDWRWRLSLAESDQHAEFSTFPNVDRELILMTGAGLRLRFADGEIRELRTRYQSHRFSGERQVRGELIAGPTKQLNLMWRSDLANAELAFRLFAEPIPLANDVGKEWAVHLLTGRAEILGGRKSLRLRPGDTALLGGGRDVGCLIDGAGELIQVTVTPHAGDGSA
jgi:environmental stress-induced protein Ves